MTTVRLVRSSTGAVRSCSADGHAGYAAHGADIVCAAVTVLLRTAMQLLSETGGIEFETGAVSRGTISFSVKTEDPGPDTLARLICIGDFLEEGIGSLSKEYPENVKLLRKQTEA